MKKRNVATLVFFLCALMLASQQVVAQAVSPEQLVREFQRQTHAEMDCRGSDGARKPQLVGPKMAGSLSHDFYKVFMRVQCDMRLSLLSNLHDLRVALPWDMRFGFTFGMMGGSELKSVLATNIRAKTLRSPTDGKALVKVLYDGLGFKDLTATYTVIREDGQWKIDDIAVKGYTTGGGEPEVLVYGSKSIKAEMQATYQRAEAKCMQDSKCRVKLNK